MREPGVLEHRNREVLDRVEADRLVADEDGERNAKRQHVLALEEGFAAGGRRKRGLLLRLGAVLRPGGLRDTHPVDRRPERPDAVLLKLKGTRAVFPPLSLLAFSHTVKLLLYKVNVLNSTTCNKL